MFKINNCANYSPCCSKEKTFKLENDLEITLCWQLKRSSMTTLENLEIYYKGRKVLIKIAVKFFQQIKEVMQPTIKT